MCGQFHAPAALIPGKEPQVPFVLEAVRTPRAGLEAVEMRTISVGNLIPRESSPLPATIPTKLSRLPVLQIFQEIIHSELMNTCHATVDWQLP